MSGLTNENTNRGEASDETKLDDWSEFEIRLALAVFIYIFVVIDACSFLHDRCHEFHVISDLP